MDFHILLEAAPALTALVLLAQLAYKAGKQEQRILQLEANRSADSIRLEEMSRLMRETRDSVVRLEARTDAYFQLQQENN